MCNHYLCVDVKQHFHRLVACFPQNGLAQKQSQPSSCDGGGGAPRCLHVHSVLIPLPPLRNTCLLPLSFNSDVGRPKIFPQVLCSPIYIYTSEESFRQALLSGVIFYLCIHCMQKLHSFYFSIQTFIKQKYKGTTLVLHWFCKIQIPAGRPYNRTNCFPVVTQSHSRERAVSFKSSIFRNHYLKPCWNTTLPSVGTLGS